jgi:hypothetical protein
MIRCRSSVFYLLSIVFLALLSIGMPFIHLHPQVTHADHSGEHTHVAVIHTLFSPEGLGDPAASQYSSDPENSEEFLRTAIGYPLYPQRLSTESISGGTDPSLISLTPILLHASEGAPLRGDADFPKPSSWVGTPSPSRAPPVPPFSSQI